MKYSFNHKEERESTSTTDIVINDKIIPNNAHVTNQIRSKLNKSNKFVSHHSRINATNDQQNILIYP